MTYPKIVFFAHHNTGVLSIKSLIDKQKITNILKVYTHKDSAPEGVWYESVSNLCKKNNISYSIPKNINKYYEEIFQLSPDIIFSIGFKQIIKDPILSMSNCDLINFHGSLLPKYRGRAPLNWAIINGETETGLTAHYIDKGIDTGDIICQEKIDIKPEDDINSVSKKIYKLYPILINKIINKKINGSLIRFKQNESEATFFKERKPEDGRISWGKNIEYIYNFIRAQTRPYPGAYSLINKKKIIIWRSKIIDNYDSNFNQLENGTIVKVENNSLHVYLNKKILLIDDYKFFGEKKKISPYSRFGS